MAHFCVLRTCCFIFHLRISIRKCTVYRQMWLEIPLICMGHVGMGRGSSFANYRAKYLWTSFPKTPKIGRGSIFLDLLPLKLCGKEGHPQKPAKVAKS